MLDNHIKPAIDPILLNISKHFRAWGFEANDITLVGLFFSILSFPALFFQVYWLAFLLIALNRLMDGIDGFIARLDDSDRTSLKRQFGGFFDVFSDFVLYSGFVLFFALGYGEEGYIAGLCLLFAYILNAVCFFGYALFSSVIEIESKQTIKSFAFLAGIAEGTETIIYMMLCCFFPLLFPLFTFLFAGICIMSAIFRFWSVYNVYKTFQKQNEMPKK